MAFVGNDIFGHGMTHSPSSLVQTTGFGHGSGGFGTSAQTSTFGQGMVGNSGFGQGGSRQPLNPNQPFFHRQNSLLTDMTHSKTDPKPVYVSEFNQSQVRHEDQLYSNMYAKPLEKPVLKPQTTQERRKTFQRQSSVSIPDDFDRPPKLGPRTRSMSLSLYDDDRSLKPMNMDIAQPILRRSSTVSAKSDKTHQKHKFLRPLSLGHRFRKRSDSRSSQSSTEPPRSEPPRSSKYHEEIETHGHPTKSRSSAVPTSPKSEDEHAGLILSLMNPPSSPDTDTNIQYRTDKQQDHPNTQKNKIPTDEIIESPTSVRRRFQQAKPSDHDDLSLKSGRSTPKSVHVMTTPSLYRTLTIEKPLRTEPNSSRQSPVHSETPETDVQTFNNYKPEVKTGRKCPKYHGSDSENSEPYYDCENSEEFKKKVRKEHGERKKGKRKPPEEKPRPSKLSTGTNSDDEFSNPDSPKTVLKDPDPFHKYENSNYNDIHHDSQSDNPYNDATLCVRDIIDTFNRKTKDTATETPPSPTYVKPEIRDIVASMTFAKHFGSEIEKQAEHDKGCHSPVQFANNPADTIPERLPGIIIPKYENIKGQEPQTAESSESGYTSNLQNSPRDFELKAAQYVNSLPYNSAHTENRKSTGNDLLRNGSQTDSDNESELSEAPCKSGSDTDYHMSDPETVDESVSHLEVMKILESPSDVAQRFNNSQIKERSNPKQASREKCPITVTKTVAPVVHSANSAFTEKRSSMRAKSREKSEDSETGIKHLHISEPKTTKMAHETQAENNLNLQTDTVVVHTTKPGSNKATAETRLMSKKSTPSFAATLLDSPLLGFRKQELSSVAQTQCTSCLDSFLHVLNVFLFVSSAGVVAVGMWLLLKEFNVNHIAEIFGNSMIQIIMYTAVGGAALALLTAMCLCCGVRRDKFGLGFYASSLVVVVLALATAAILCIIFADKLKGIEFKLQFKDRLIDRYGNTRYSPMENRFFTESWDMMQQEFKCCGADGNVNDTTSWAVYKKFSTWFKLHPDKATHFVPESCCAPNADTSVCMGSDHHLFGPPVYGPPMEGGFNTRNPNLNTDGCYKMVSSYLMQLITFTALVTGGLAALYFLVVMLTWVFCFKRREDGDYDYSSYEYEDDVFDEEEEEEEEETEESATNVTNMKDTEADDDDEEDTVHQATVHRLPSEQFSDDKTTVDTQGIHSSKSRTSPYYSDRINNDMETILPVPEEEALDRRDRYERSDSRLDHMFAETIEEEDSNFEDSDVEDQEDYKNQNLVRNY